LWMTTLQKIAGIYKAAFTQSPVVVESGTNFQPGTTACVGTSVTTSSNVQAALDAAPSGSTFCFAAGTYHVSSLAPKSGDVLDGGSQGAVLDGQNTIQFVVDSSGTSNVTFRGVVVEDYTSAMRGGAEETEGAAGGES